MAGITTLQVGVIKGGVEKFDSKYQRDLAGQARSRLTPFPHQPTHSEDADLYAISCGSGLLKQASF